MSPTPHASRYFAYGSNLNKTDMRTRCPDARPDAPAKLKGWRLTFRGVADIEPAEGRTVHGALWWLSPDDIRGLDRYEGAPSNYRQRVVEVQTGEGRVTAMTYVMTHPDYLGLPSRWYLSRIETGFEEWSLPRSELIRALRETQAELAERGRGCPGFRPRGSLPPGLEDPSTGSARLSDVRPATSRHSWPVRMVRRPSPARREDLLAILPHRSFGMGEHSVQRSAGRWPRRGRHRGML
jgi:gamma-glutamylcyclotransferase (GGCT)/AIG2-like uncharacterized protein YtfP